MNSPAYIDVHSHLLPGIDDGCVSLGDSLHCVRTLQQHGFRGTICTPHVGLAEYPQNSPSTIAQGVERLQTDIQSAGLDYPIWAGAEVRLTKLTIPFFGEQGVPTLGSSRCVMLDTWGERWEPFCQAIVDFLFEHNYQPVLAHPERMNLQECELEQLLGRLKDSGVWLQGNLRCITGAEGSLPQERICRWLGEGRYDLLATDMHSPKCLAQRLEGIAVVKELFGAERLAELLGRRPNEIVSAADSGERGA